MISATSGLEVEVWSSMSRSHLRNSKYEPNKWEQSYSFHIKDTCWSALVLRPKCSLWNTSKPADCLVIDLHTTLDLECAKVFIQIQCRAFPRTDLASFRKWYNVDLEAIWTTKENKKIIPSHPVPISWQRLPCSHWHRGAPLEPSAQNAPQLVTFRLSHHQWSQHRPVRADPESLGASHHKLVEISGK